MSFPRNDTLKGLANTKAIIQEYETRAHAMLCPNHKYDPRRRTGEEVGAQKVTLR